MKYLLIIFGILINLNSWAQCAGVSATGTSVNGNYKSCNETVVQTSTLNTVNADTLSCTKLTVTNLTDGMLKSVGDVVTPAVAGTDYYDTTGLANNTEVINVNRSTFVGCWGNSITFGLPTSASISSFPFLLDSLSGNSCFNFGIGGETSTQIKTRFLQNTDKLNYSIIIEAGRNNITDSTTVLADIAAMVAVIPHNRYIILSILNGASEGNPSTAYSQITAINNRLSTIYGSHYLDVRAYLVSQYNPGIPQDVTDHAADIVPTSLRYDNIHPNHSGNLKTAQYIFSQKASILFPASNKIINPEGAAKIATGENPGVFKSSLSVIGGGYGPPIGSTIVTNGTFTGSLTGWTAGANWSSSSNRALHTAGSTATLTQSITLEASFPYEISFDVALRTAGTATVTFGSLTGTIDGTVSGTYTYSFFSTSAAAFTFTITPTSTFDGAIDNVIVRKITRYILPTFSVTHNDTSRFDNFEIRSSQPGLFNMTAGQSCFLSNTLGARNTTYAYNGLQINVTGNDNSSFGYFSLRNNTSGSRNNAFGVFSLNANVSGNDNIAIGYASMQNNLSASQNTGIGSGALRSCTSGGGNVIMGYFAGTTLTTGTTNVGIGNNALATVLTGGFNTGIGHNSLNLATGNGNTALGRNSGSTISSGTFNTIIGAFSEPASATTSGQLNIGNVIYGLNLYQTGSSSSTPTTTGSVGIGLSAPTARFHLPAGTATANTTPFKYTTGVLTTVPEAGAKEYDGANEYLSVSTTRYTIAKTLTNTATLDFGSTAGGAATDLTITVTGAASGDVVSVGVPNGSVPNNGVFFGWVSASDTVTVRFINPDQTNAKDPSSGTFRISVIKY